MRRVPTIGLWIVVTTALLSSAANAQITVFKPLQLSHVKGLVTDWAGKPISGAVVTLDRKGAVELSAKSDQSGRFRIDGGDGRYWLHVGMPHYQTASRDVIIGADLLTLFRSEMLYVMLGPSACMDECSWTYTSKKKFDRAVRERAEKHD